MGVTSDDRTPNPSQAAEPSPPAGEELLDALKRLRENEVTQYSLRVSEMRVYYDVVEAEHLVLIKAVAVKDRDRVFAGGEELKL